MKQSILFLMTWCALSSWAAVLSAQYSEPIQLQSIADFILKSKNDSDAKELLYQAIVFEFAKRGEADALEAMAKRGAELNLRDGEGNSLLHFAASGGHKETVSLLLKNGVGIDALNQSQRSALFSAALSNQLEIVKSLLDAGADINGSSRHNSPLNAASWYGYPEIVKLLLERGADIDRRDVDGNSALHKAVWQGNYQCASLLLKAGADKHAKNNFGQTPIGVADERKHQLSKSKTGNRPWGTEQVLGPPDAGDGYSQLEWCPSTDQGSDDWLMVYFDEAVVPKQLEVYAKPSPRSVEKITAFDSEGRELVLWEGNELKAASGRSAHIAVIVPEIEEAVEQIKIYVNSTKVSGWVYYDAVGLTDAAGKTQWAAWARSSTCYATGEMPKQLTYRRVFELLQQESH